MSRRVRVFLGPRQAEALLEVAGRGLDEWQYELDEANGSVHGTAAQHRKALEAYRVLASALEGAGR